MRKMKKILASILCMLMLGMIVNAFAAGDVPSDEGEISLDEEILAVDEIESVDEVELYASGSVCYIGDDAETGIYYSDLNTAISEATAGSRIKLIANASMGNTDGARKHIGKNLIFDGENPDGDNFSISFTSEIQVMGSEIEFYNVNILLGKYRFRTDYAAAKLTFGEGTVVTGSSEASGSNLRTNGGAVQINTGSTVIMESGSTVTGCTTEKGSGGAFFLNGGNLTIKSGAKIENCTSVGNGGAIVMQNYVSGDGITTVAVINLEGGTIEGNTAASNGGGIYVNSGSLMLSGDAEVTDNREGESDSNIKLASAGLIALSDDFTGSAEVSITGQTHGLEIGTVAEGASGAENIKTSDGALIGYAEEGKLYLVSDGACYIGESYFTGTVYETLDGAMTVAEGATIHLLKDGATFSSLQSAVIDGTKKDGSGYYTIKAIEVNPTSLYTGPVMAQGENVSMQNVTVDLNQVKLQIRGAWHLKENTTVKNGYGVNGGAAIIEGTGRVYMYPGSTVRECATSGSAGGAFFINGGQLTMTGGTITGNKGSKGAIHVQGNGKVNISGRANITDNFNSSGAEGNFTISLDSTTGALLGTLNITDDFSGELEKISISGAVHGLELGTVAEGAVGSEKITSADGILTGYAENGKLYLVTDGVCYIGENGYTSSDSVVYSELVKAMQDAKGATIHLLCDTTWSPNSGNNMYWVNGAVIDGTKDSSSNYTVSVTAQIKLVNSGRIEFNNVTLDLNKTYLSTHRPDETLSCTLVFGSGTHVKNGQGANSGAVEVSANTEVIMKDGSLVTECEATNVGGAFIINGGTLTMEGGTITGNAATNKGGGIWVQGGGTVNVSGNATITGNKVGETENNLMIPGTNGTFNITGNFSGKIGTTLDSKSTEETFGTVAAGAVIDKIDCITIDSGTYYGYIDGTNLKWTTMPELTVEADSGVYSDGTGVIRFLTTFNGVNGASIEKYGTYALATDSFDVTTDSSSLTKFADFTVTPAAGKAYIVDIVEIPADKLDTQVMGVSFVKIKGVETPVYVPYVECVSVNGINSTVKNLGEKVS